MGHPRLALAGARYQWKEGNSVGEPILGLSVASPQVNSPWIGERL